MIAGSRPSVIAWAVTALLHASAITALASAEFDRAQPTEPDPVVVTLIPEQPPPPPPPPRAPARAAPPAPTIRAARPIAARAPAPPTLVASVNSPESVAPAASAPPAPMDAASAPPAPMAAASEPTRVAAAIDAGRSCRIPTYPPAARRDHQTGIVVLKFLIDEDGGVVDSQVAESSGVDSLDLAARDALTLCRFRPGTVDGRPERGWVAMRYVWRLN